MSKEEQLTKNKIVAIVRRNGRSMLTQQIADHLTAQEAAQLGPLLGELVADGRLVQGFTLLPNGEASHTYV